ncbi:hypothetical protein MKW92_048353 [Papaver armeniacum]|nr:hypothetical protein MKW92_048353 [Papaver armeniacum]
MAPEVTHSSSSFPNLTKITHLISVKLSDSNYLIWRTQLNPLIRGYRLKEFVDGTHPCPPPTLTDGKTENPIENPAYVEWMEQEAIILGWLFSSMTDSVLLEVGDLETSKAVWMQ